MSVITISLSASNASPGVDLRRVGVLPWEALVAEEKPVAANFTVLHHHTFSNAVLSCLV
jgi:hypothetical protein